MMLMFHQAFRSLAVARGVLMVLTLVTLSLPSKCDGVIETCSYNTAHTIANCSARQLEIVPSGLHKSITTLDLSGNNFPRVTNHSFISYKYIKELYLKNNSIHIIEDNAFQSLDYLRMLDLSNNKLMHVPSAALKPISRAIIQLVLSGNKINIISRGIFENLANLQHLDLSGNSIYRVNYGAFLGLRSMKVFKIRHNALQSLPSDSFDDFKDIVQVQLYDNRWFCDCEMRWLRAWMNDTDSKVWDTPGYDIRCDGPSIVRDKPLDSLPMDDLACEVQMKTSGSSRELPKGANTTLLCKYSSIPEAEAMWLRNSEIIDVSKNSKKYSIESWATESSANPMERTQISELKIRGFQYKDIAKYECFVRNIRGDKTTAYKLTLEGVDFESVTPSPPAGRKADSGVDTRSIVIAVAVVCGIILLVVIGILIFCTVNRVQRKKQEKQDAIVENVKQHFINSEVNSNGDIAGLNDTKMSSKSMEDKLDRTNDDDRSMSNNTNDSNATAVKRPLDLNETEPSYIWEQPGSPFNNGNTYVSFGSELTDPGEFQEPPVLPPQYPHMSTSSRYESSHAGSATPLLERYTPSVFDSDEPVEDYAQYPVYDSLTNSLQHPHSENNYTPNNRNGSTSSYSSHRTNGDPAKRLSSFHYPSSTNGSMPRTPVSTRSTMALAPRYSEYEGSPRQEPHHPTHHPSEYRDYREMRYPGTTPPPHRMTAATQKSMSVGNLGYAPLSTGPRKPPRLFQSREYMELTPQETNGDYITSPEAQQYSQNYGITPGTPV